MGIVFRVIEQVEELCKENELESVASVTLSIGEVSAVVDSYLDDCWKWAVAKSEPMKAATLKIEKIPAVTLCDACGATYSTVEHGRTFPACSSGETHLLKGNEVMIKEIETC
jgi:Zn finger protein HypA/HybF (possibly regulating hydrogenase expression)